MPDTLQVDTDDMDLLNEEDTNDNEGVVVEKDKEEETPEEIEEEPEETEEEPEETEEEEESEVEPQFVRSSVKEIKSKYPEFFKDFPTVKEAIFRDQQYTSIFPTIDDAKESFTDSQAFSALSEASLAGNPVPVMESLEKTDPKAFNTFSRSFLPALYKRNQEVYQEVITPLFENALRQAYASGDENMKNSATNIAQFLFGSDGPDSVEGKKTLAKGLKVDEEQKDLKTARESREAKEFLAASGDVQTRLDKNLKALISKNFDPNNVFTKFTLNAAVNEVLSRINKQLANDKSHMQIMASCWKKATRNGYSEDEKVKIISTFLARAKSLIPHIREEVRSAALGKVSRAAVDKSKKIGVHKETTNVGRPYSGNNGNNLRKQDFRKMTDDEILAL
jgi:hypothetical protein